MDRRRKTVESKRFYTFKSAAECVSTSVNLTVRHKCVRHVALLPSFIGGMPICRHFLRELACRGEECFLMLHCPRALRKRRAVYCRPGTNPRRVRSHTFNSLYESHKQIVITSDKFPKEIPGLEDRHSSGDGSRIFSRPT